MSDIERPEVRHQLERWIQESQALLGRIIPGLLDDNERLRGKVAAAEQDRDRMRMEIGQLRREIADLTKDLTQLQADRQYVRGEQTAIAEAVSRALHHMSQLAQPMNEILQRVHVAEVVPADDTGVEDRV
jgi:chromosome segregation ATPase